MPASSARITRLVRVLLLMAVLGSLYRGYWVYSLESRSGGIGPYLDFVHGVGPAPFQYRVTPVLFSYFFYKDFHVPFRYGFSLLDSLTLVLAVMLGFEILRRSPLFRQASALLQFFGAVTYLALVVYMLAWGEWYKKNETDTAAALAMLLLLAWSPRAPSSKPPSLASRWLTSLAILALVAALSTVRADVAVCASLGMLALTCLRRRGDLSLPRPAAIALAAGSVLTAVATQALMMKIVYPHARPYAGQVFMLLTDIWRPNELAEFLIYTAPALWALWQIRKLRFTQDAPAVGFLLGAIPFLLLWMAIGRIEEVRIFLPLGLAVAPLIAQLAMTSAAGDVSPTAASPTAAAPLG